MADERFSNAIESITGIRDPFAPKPAPKQTPAKQVSAAPPAPSYEELIAAPQRELAEAEKSYGEFQGMQAANEAEREALRMQRGSQALGTYRTALEAPKIREERAQLEEKISKPFVPTRDNFQDMAVMYSLIGVLGFAIGAGGKGNAINAMSAMNGMMEGYRQGREDLYEKEKDAFEANTQALQTKINSLNNKMKEIADLAKVDYEKANLQADMLFAEEGADFLKQYKDKVGLVGTIKMLQEKVKGSEKLFEFMTKERDRYDEKERDRQFRADLERQREQDRRERQEDQQRFEAQMKQQERNLRRELAAQRQEGKTGLKPGARITEGYVADNQLITDLSYMKNQLKDPELQEYLKKYQVQGFLSEEAKVLDQVLMKDVPPKLRQFLTTVRDVRNNYYLNISGKAVTGGEALRNYGTVPQPGDTADRMIDKIEGMERRVGQKIMLTQRLYPSLPSLQGANQPGQGTSLRPGQDYSRDTADNEIPARPSGVPDNAAYSPSQGKWWWQDSAGKWQSK